MKDIILKVHDKYFKDWNLILPLLIVLFIIVNYIRHGLIITPDSTGYIEIANNVSLGKGVVFDNGKIVSHWGFVYPLLVGVFSSFFGFSANDSAFLLNVILTILVYFEFKELLNIIFSNLFLSNCKLEFSTFFVVLYFSGMIFSSLSFMSEYLYSFLAIKFIVSSMKLIGDANPRIVDFIFLGLLGIFLFYTRYIGISLLITTIFLYVVYNFRSKNLYKIIYFILVVVFYIAGWNLLMQYLPNGSVGFNRVLRFHPISFEKIKCGIDYFNSLFLIRLNIISDYLSCVIFASAFLILLFLFFIKIIKYRNIYFPIIFVFLYVSIYIFILFLTILFIDASTPLDWRLLSPLSVFFVLLIYWVVINFNMFFKFRRYILIYLIVVSLSNSFTRLHKLFLDGEGLRSKYFREHSAIQYINRIGGMSSKKQYVFSNGPDYLKANSIKRNIVFLHMPMKYFPTTNLRNNAYEKKNRQMFDLVRTNGSYHFVFIDGLNWRKYYPNMVEIKMNIIRDSFQFIKSPGCGSCLILTKRIMN